MSKKLYTTDSEIEHVSLESFKRYGRQVSTTPIPLYTARMLLEKQLITEGLRDRTIYDYLLWFDKFVESTGIKLVSEINADTVYYWLDHMNVKNSSKLVRLKSLKAVLGRLFDRGWINEKFWKSIKIKVDTPTKKGTDPQDLEIYLNLLDLTNYFELRDAVAVLLMYKTGIRSATMAQLKEEHLDLGNSLLRLSGDIMKNRQSLILPIDNQLIKIIKTLLKENKKIRQHTNQNNSYVFVSRTGRSIYETGHSNIIQKRLNSFSNKYGIKNINPHSLRRAYAKNLYNRGANVALISKALDHKSLEVTTRYLDITQEELVSSLREFL